MRRGPALHHIVITGASSGIGAAFARHYARAGVLLTLSGRDAVRLEAVADTCRREAGATVTTVTCDVTDADAMTRWLQAADDQRPVDGLIANAGMAGIYALPIEDPTWADAARRIFTVNMLGVVNTVVPLVPRMAARGAGHIGLISSMAAFHSFPRAPEYCATKAALRSYGQGLRYLLLPQGVGVTVACPGFVTTPMSAALPFVAPFQWTAERTVARIARAIAARQPEVSFPWQLRLAAAGAHLLPQAALDYLFTRPPGHWLTG